MKKLIALLLALVMVLGLAACGGDEPKKDDDKETTVQTEDGKETTNDGEENRETEPTQPTETEDDDMIYAQNNQYWGMKVMDMPQIPELTWEEKPFGSATLNIATTPFDYDVDQVYEGLKNNEYLGSLYGEFAVTHRESDTGEYFTDVGEQIAYGKTVSFEADLKSAKFYSLKSIGDFRVSYYRSTANYANYNSVSLTFTFEKEEDIDQKKILEVAELVFGKEYAEQLVYAVSSKEVKNVESGTVWGCDLEEFVQSGDCYYYLKREFYQMGDTIIVSFDLGVEGNPRSNAFIRCYGQDDTSMYSQMKYSFADMLPQTLGGTDPLTFHTFGDSYFKKFYPAYLYSYLDFLTLGVYETESGKTGYEYSVQVFGGCTDMSKIMAPKLTVDAYIEEENGQIYKMDFSVKGEARWFAGGETKEGQAHVDALLEMMNTIYPDLDLSALSYTEGAYNCETDVTMEVMGQTLSGTAQIKYDESIKIELELQ